MITQKFPLYASQRAEATTDYTFSQMSLADIETINLAIRAKIVRAARLSLDDNCSQFERMEVLDSANRSASEVSLLSGLHARHFGSIEGQAQILATIIGKNTPGFTIEDAFQIARDDRNEAEIAFAFECMKGFTVTEIDEMRAKEKSSSAGAKPETPNPTTLSANSANT